MLIDTDKIENAQVKELLDSYICRKNRKYYLYEGEMISRLVELNYALSISKNAFNEFLTASEKHFYEFLEDLLTFVLKNKKS